MIVVCFAIVGRRCWTSVTTTLCGTVRGGSRVTVTAPLAGTERGVSHAPPTRARYWSPVNHSIKSTKHRPACWPPITKKTLKARKRIKNYQWTIKCT